MPELEIGHNLANVLGTLVCAALVLGFAWLEAWENRRDNKNG